MKNNEYKEIAKQLFVIANEVDKGDFPTEAFPINDIINLVNSIYHSKVEESTIFSELYRVLIERGIENSNSADISCVLRLFAEHILLFLIDDIKLNDATLKNFRLQSRIGYLENCERIRKKCEMGYLGADIPFEGKGCVYSAITGNYDDIKEPEMVNPEWDYIMFTNNPSITSSVWKVYYLEDMKELDNIRLARFIKIMGHEYLREYDYSIWVDGKIKIKDNLREFIERYRRKEPMLCFNHYVNDCVYQEWKACISLQKDDLITMEKQMECYREEGYPEHNGMIDSAILIRDLRSEKMKEVMHTWWKQILNGSRRDQLSFNYSCWKNDFLYDTTDLFIYRNKYVEVYEHN